MHTDEDSDGGEKDRSNGRDKGGAARGDRINIGGGDDQVVRIQLAARWAESNAPENGDSLVGALKRFRLAYEYLDAVIHGVEPVEPVEPEPEAPRPVAAAAPAAPAPEPEAKPWG
jgi:hypothetical protein